MTARLSEAQNKALAALQMAQRGGSLTGVVPNGWGHSLRTMRSLQRLGLCTVTEHPAYGHVRNGRFVMPRAGWTATITHDGICRVAVIDGVVI